MSLATYLNTAGQIAVIPLNTLANLNQIGLTSATEIMFTSAFSPQLGLRAIGSGITTDGTGVITGGTITALEFLVDGLVQMRLTLFAPLDAVAAAAAFTGGSLPGYDLMIALLGDDTEVVGSNANDWIDTGLGDDTVNASFGNDRVSKFMAGDLTYDGGDGSDTLNLGAENGLIYPTPFIRQFVVNLSTGVGLSPYGGAFALTSVENVIGTSQADRITGNNSDNVIGDGIFDRGADIIRTLGGNDTVKMSIQESGVDANGGSGADTIFISTFGGQAGVNVIDLQNSAANTGVFLRSSFAQFENVTFYENAPDVRLDFRGSAAANRVEGGWGNDVIDGRAGADMLLGGAGADRLIGGLGADSMQGGTGNDIYFIDNRNDFTLEFFQEGIDEVRSTVTHTLAFEVERLTLLGSNDIAGVGNGSNNILRGNDGDNVLTGAGGADHIYGGLGADTFLFSDTFDSPSPAGQRDFIRDFAAGDLIDLRAIDADAGVNGDQAFAFDQGGALAAGELRVTSLANGVLVSINVDGGGADMAFYVLGVTTLAEADFLL